MIVLFGLFFFFLLLPIFVAIMFVLNDFITKPTVTALFKLTKAEWVALATHYKLQCSPSLRKDEVKQSVLAYFVKEEIFTEEEVDLLEHPNHLIALRQIELEEKRLEVEKLKADNDKLRLTHNPSSTACTFKTEVALKFVPKFDEEDPEGFFTHFEKSAGLHAWPKDKWVLLINNSFTGRAQEVFNALDVTQIGDYDFVKKTVLHAYKKVPEAYRQQFRRCRKAEEQTYVEFIRRKQQLCNKWVESELTSPTVEDLLELFLLEEVKSCLPDKVRSHIEEKGLRTLSKVGEAADHFFLTTNDLSSKNRLIAQQPKPPSSSQNRPPVNKTLTVSQGPFSKLGECAGGGVRGVTNQDEKKSVFCRYCKKPGHTLRDCKKLASKHSATQGSAVLHTSALTQPLEVGDPQVGDLLVSGPCEHSCDSVDVPASFKPFCSKGVVSERESSTFSTPVIVLRDTGSDLSCILKEAVPSFDCYTGETVLVSGLPGEARYPLCSVHLQSAFVTGLVTLAVVDHLPVKNISVLIGHDLGGSQVTANPIVSEKPIMINDTFDLEMKHPSLFPTCAVTRSMSQKVLDGQTPAEGTEDPPEYETESRASDFVGEVSHLFDDASGKFSTTQIDFSSTPITRERLASEQTTDPSCKLFLAQCLEDDDIDKVPQCFYLKSGVLMRKFRPPNVPASQTWETVHQIVVPKSLRTEIMKLAHDGVSGHLGVRKTYHKILSHFYWPRLMKDVSNYCRTCHVCQISGKPGTDVKPAPLQPIPVMEEPFSKVIIDCVGPLPKSKRGNQYLLTIMDVATRYPEAIPLRSITTKNVVRALIKFFTQVGLPTIVQSDQGSNFTSKFFQQVMRTLGIRQCLSTAFHPQSQGALERFHSTMKTMLRTYCMETGQDWDEAIDLLLFSIRDSTNESLGFTPFQLIYGHQVRGPLKVLKECWLDDNDNTVPVAAYVTRFHSNLKRALEVAHSNLSHAQVRMKNNYDKFRKAQTRTFQVGDKVLALLPIPKQPLQSRYSGPYDVLERVGDLNYVIATPERRKKKRCVHVNLLKLYYSRDQSQGGVEKVILTGSKSLEKSEESDQTPFVGTKLSNQEILANIVSKLEHLPPAQTGDIEDLLQEYPGLFGDTPRLCTLLPHDVDVQGAPPIRQAPYRLSAEKRRFLQSEVQRLKDQGLIRPSISPWASPVVLVPKAGGSYRLCVDYRKVNAVTLPDSYPLPRMDDIIDNLGTARYVSKLDLLQGYYQVPLTERAKPISAFVTPFGLWEFVVLPFGMRNAPGTFQRLMNHLIAELPGVRVYLDDLVVWSDTWEEHLERLRKLFRVLEEAKLTVNLAKSEFGHAHVVYLGHVVGQGQLAPVAAKVDAILQYPTPADRKSLMRFLGMVGYYRRFCRNFAQVAVPLTDQLSCKREFCWTDACQRAFEGLKALLASAPVLRTPDPHRPFVIRVDASDAGVGAVLLQEYCEVLHPTCYFSQKFKSYQKSYATVEKEALGIVMAIENFEVFLSGSAYPITVFTDHNPLVFIEKVKFKNARVLRWALALQPYNIKVQHIRGKDNTIADALSRV